MTPEDVLRGQSRRFIQRWGDRAPALYLAGCGTSDITQPYHSLSYLAGALNVTGHSYAVQDLNLALWRYLIEPSVVRELRRECSHRKDEPDPERRTLLRFFHDFLEDDERFARAWACLQSQRFYEVRHYLAAVHDLNALPQILTLLSRQSVYRTFSSMSPSGALGDRIDLQLMRLAVERGFGIEVLDHFYDHHAEHIAASGVTLAGFTVPFLSQLEHSLALGHRLKKLGISVAMGGPIAAKFYKYSKGVDKLATLNFAVDYLVVGEGETLIGELAERATRGHLGALRKRSLLVHSRRDRNLIDLNHPQALAEVHFENVDALPPPDYSLWDYEEYASPEPGALYSPTRGCYWNKCSFCDYGLSQGGPTSPWRMRSPERVVEDLRAASQYVKNFFFAVDVLSPSYALKLSSALIDAKLPVHWMADFRLESTFKPEKAAVFRDAGCVGAAFGMESADQEVLDSMDKGTDVTRLANVVDAFAGSAIPVQLMGFTGFPGETQEQADTTFRVAHQLSSTVATVALGKFGLTPGSDVAKNPEAYGVRVDWEERGASDIPWELGWTLTKTPAAPLSATDFSASLQLMRGYPFPFLGATTTLHSLLYFKRSPKAPFAIPRWWVDLDAPGDYLMFSALRAQPGETLGESVLQSALTGRALLTDTSTEQLFGTFLKQEGVLLKTPVTAAAREVLQLAIDNSLALFVPASAVG